MAQHIKQFPEYFAEQLQRAELHMLFFYYRYPDGKLSVIRMPRAWVLAFNEEFKYTYTSNLLPEFTAIRSIDDLYQASPKASSTTQT